MRRNFWCDSNLPCKTALPAVLVGCGCFTWAALLCSRDRVADMPRTCHGMYTLEWLLNPIITWSCHTCALALVVSLAMRFQVVHALTGVVVLQSYGCCSWML